MTMERTAKTRVLDVHSAVRRRILGGQLLPGEKLSPSVLAQEYGVSLGVVREALTRLAEQGIVLSQPQQGFQVIPISREDLLDLTATRLDIETLALARSIERGTVEWRSELMAAHYVLANTTQFEPPQFEPPQFEPPQFEPPQFESAQSRALNEDWARAHQLFHAQLISACGSARLLEFAQSLRDSAEVYRRWSSPIGGDAQRDIAGEHLAILQAVEAGDAEAAVKQLAEHISHTTNVLLKHAT